MSKKASQSNALLEVAFSYPGPMWSSGDALKNLLLFFDGIALLVPSYMKGKPEEVDPIMAQPLRKAGLLHILEPETLVDKGATQELASAVSGLIRSGSFDGLRRARGQRFTNSHVPGSATSEIQNSPTQSSRNFRSANWLAQARMEFRSQCILLYERQS